MNASSEAYFAARPHYEVPLAVTAFEAGFRRAWEIMHRRQNKINQD